MTTKAEPDRPLPAPMYRVSQSISIKFNETGDLTVYSSVSRPVQKIDEIDLAIMKAFAVPQTIEAVVTVVGSQFPGKRDGLPERVSKLLANGIVRSSLADVQERGAMLKGGFAAAALHHWMLRDHVRVSAYRAAIFKHAPGKRVLEIGCGSGVLSIFAAQAGAARVTAIEETVMALLAAKMFAANRVNVQLLVGNSMDVELPERADLLIHELLGVDPFFENILKYVGDAKKRLLVPGAQLLPYRVDVCCVGVEAEYVPPVLERVRQEAQEFDKMYQVNFAPYRQVLGALTEIDDATVPRRGADLREALYLQPILTKECLLRTVDLNGDLEATVAASLNAELEVASEGKLGSLLVYFRAYFDPDHALATSPFTPRTHWGWAVRDLARVVSVRPGDRVPLLSQLTETQGRHRLRVVLG
jgi:2-polyprenyl-3-methyl-5-hydroxy-6-metoxy-1,4-benzoquinol methylase